MFKMLPKTRNFECVRQLSLPRGASGLPPKIPSECTTRTDDCEAVPLHAAEWNISLY